MLVIVDTVECPETIIWPEADFPSSSEDGRTPEWFAIPCLDVGLELQLFLQCFSDVREVSWLYGLEVLLYSWSVEEIKAFPRGNHDYYYSHKSPIVNDSPFGRVGARCVLLAGAGLVTIPHAERPKGYPHLLKEFE